MTNKTLVAELRELMELPGYAYSEHLKALFDQINSAAARYNDLSACYDVVSQASKDKGVKLEAAEARISELEGLVTRQKETLVKRREEVLAAEAGIAKAERSLEAEKQHRQRGWNEAHRLEAELSATHWVPVPVGLVEIGMASTINPAEFCYVFHSKQFIPYGMSLFTHPAPPVDSDWCPAGLHPETKKLVRDFASALAGKLNKAEIKYGYQDGWKKKDWYDDCLQDLWRHLEKGDPRDVAAYCAFMWYHGWVTTTYEKSVLPVRAEHAEWSQATFGNVGPVGPLKHLSKEAIEAAEAPDDLSEWADMQFLFWDAQRRAGITDSQIEQAMIEKLAINKARTWPKPRDGEPRFHLRRLDRQA